MFRAIFLMLIGFVAIPLTKPPWTVLNASPATVMELYGDANRLPKCAQLSIDGRLKKVIVTNDGPQKDASGLLVDATSFKNGLMVLRKMPPGKLDAAFTHELGHYYDWQNNISRSEDWKLALALDWNEMPKEMQKRNAYLQEPMEAYAELFSAHFLGDKYYVKGYYNVALFPHCMALLEATMCRDDNGDADRAER